MNYNILVVEDESLIAILLEDYLSELGYKVPWHADNVTHAMEIISSNQNIDAAILDVNIRGESVAPIASALESRGTPFCFMTGYGASASTGYPDAPIIGKPFDMADLQRTVRQLLNGRPPRSGQET
jgi:DNA-binding response OmpR family regulator